MADEPEPQGSLSRSRPARNPASRLRVERVLARCVAVFGLLYGVQAVVMALRDSPELRSGINLLFLGVILVALLAMAGAAFGGRPMTLTGTLFIAAWFVVMLLWPLALQDGADPEGRPWPWYLCIPVTITASVAWRVPAAVLTLLVVPLTYASVLLSLEGGGAAFGEVGRDAARATLLGLAGLVIVVMLRRSAADVDTAQTIALDRFSHAVGQQATEDERVQVDAIVHDTVLAALLSAAKAEGEEARALATRMATDAIASLRDALVASPDDEPAVTLSELERRIRMATDKVAPAFEYSAGSVGGATIPAKAARAVQSATLQAMVNSAQHAGGEPAVDRWVTVGGTATGGIVVEIGDTGRGFDPSITVERMGVRVSIIERVTTAGGAVALRSAPGAGTTVRIEWPAADNPGRLPHLVVPGDSVSERQAP
jgi:hypothetical protein